MRFRILQIAVALAFSGHLCGQVTRIGAEVYARTCANQYCHGPAGAVGTAPALVGRGLEPEHVKRAIRNGVPNTSMPGWAKSLSVADIEAVISYVQSLQRARMSERRVKLDAERPWLRHPGRELFFDASRTTPCGSCHAFDGLGLAVAPSFETAPSMTIGELRALESDKVATLNPREEATFPAIRAPGGAGASLWYDLSAQLPVLRTFKPGQYSIREGSAWTHRGALETYKDSELTTVLEFLREALAK